LKPTLVVFILLALYKPVCWAGPKKSGWIEVRSPHFIVESNSSKAEAKAAALQFEQIRDALELVLAGARNASEAPLTILTVGDEASLKRLLPGYFEKRGETHPAGIFVESPGGAFIVLRTDLERPGIFEPVYHEYTHFVMRQLSPGLPLWLTEGLAEFFSNTSFDGSFIFTGAADADNLSVLRSKSLLPLKTLLAVDQSSPYYTHQDQVDIFYAESWALTHYLFIQDAARGTQHVREYVEQVANGADPSATFLKVFGPLNQLDADLNLYVHKLEFSALKVRASEKLSAKTFAVRELPPAEAYADQAEFLLATGRYREAGALIEHAFEEDPNSSKASALKSALLLSSGNREEAAEWASKAIKLDPNGYLGYYNRALAMESDHMNALDAAAVEDNLERAIALRPSLSSAEVLLSGLYLSRGDKLDRAMALAKDAASRQPEETDVLINLEVLLLKQGQQATAIRIELQLLGLAHSPKAKAMVRNDIGWACLQQNVALDRADFEIHEAVRLDPGSADATDSLGYLLEKEGHPPAAADAFRHALSIQPKLASSVDGLGDVLRAEHAWKDAADEYRAEILLNSRDARAHYGLSLALQGEGDAAGAAKEITTAKILDPFNAAY